MNELQIRVNQKPGVITTNFEDIKAELSTQMDVYKELEVTEDNKPERKKDIATLRKMKKALDDRRIEVKKEYLKPCDDFEAKVKELTALIDEPIGLIDNQVKVFEEKQKTEKKQDIKDAYQELIGEVGDYLPLDRIYNSKWENVSVTMKSIREEMEEAISSTVMAVTTIKGMSSEAASQALEQYKKDLSLANAIAYVNRYEQQKAEILAREEKKRKEEEERRRRAEEERIRELERKRVAEEARIREEARQKAIEEERQRVAEEERRKAEIEAEKRKQEEEKLRAVEQAEAKPDPVQTEDNLQEEAFEEEPFAEEPFVVSDEPFTDEPFDVPEEPPFTVEEVKATFTVVGTMDELEQVEMYLNSIGLFFERVDD
ncbi:MAG TPA: hypothetical protein DEG06_05175 [Lachnospiraceae bacterium]|jgi:hypothetical protein|nr:hypothetical protein [Lachnospiraceae bacterium]HBY71616.1 hypothetical protein [Lachnospiraceae bacterium]HCA69343.1 hypothetical protein [Lachnospiraceae bacterium]HCM12747.1 hypothetical protein [Lachnospiraceae bacterium]HCR39376.1 hypothetical protein [Lachnospiraceae bacterium]